MITNWPTDGPSFIRRIADALEDHADLTVRGALELVLEGWPEQKRPAMGQALEEMILAAVVANTLEDWERFTRAFGQSLPDTLRVIAGQHEQAIAAASHAVWAGRRS